MDDAVIRLPPVRPAAAEPPNALDEPTLGRLLGALASRPGALPKYRYPSAGTLYPVQTYLVLRRPFGALMPGSHYYDPQAHALVPLSADQPPAPDGTMPAVLLVLVAQFAAIEPVYRQEAEAFCLLEAGYMVEALRQAAPGLILRDAGDPGEIGPALTASCRLDPSHRPLACVAVEAAG